MITPIVRNVETATSDAASSNASLSPSTIQKVSTVKRIKPKGLNVIPESISSNKALIAAVGLLPSNYNFEIQKSVWRIQKENVKIVAIQFPEGLLMYSLIIADIFRKFCQVEVIVLGDVTYGACCIDDFTAKKLGAQMMIHYGHSCLVPVNVTTIIVMYVFVEIFFDSSHLVECLKNLALTSSSSQSSSSSSIETTSQQPSSSNSTVTTYQTSVVSAESQANSNKKIALLGTVQFISILHQVSEKLMNARTPSNSNGDHDSINTTNENKLYKSISIPQVRPLSMGETPGCTAPLITGVDSFVFVADGRFHLEAAMIRNPHLTAYRYDPYAKMLSIERYETQTMRSIRYASIQKAQNLTKFGLILGTLGRQGSITKFNALSSLLKSKSKKLIPFLMAELNPAKLNAIPISQIEVWVQVACPRLSIDWGMGFNRPILTPYEVEVAMGIKPWTDVYPMDYYASPPK